MRHTSLVQKAVVLSEKIDLKATTKDTLDDCGSFVVCTALREHEDRVEFYVTRNNGLDQKDLDFLARFETVLPAIFSPEKSSCEFS